MTFVFDNSQRNYKQAYMILPCALLDATKAFDRINYGKLFKRLQKRELPFEMMRLLAYLYTNNFLTCLLAKH